MDEIRKMRTAEEMYEYYQEIRKDVKPGDFRLDNRKLFQDPLNKYKTAEAFLEPDEYCVTTFRMYVCIYEYVHEHQRWIYILTNKRVITVNFDSYGVECVDWDRIARFEAKDGNFVIDCDVYRRSLSEVFVAHKQDFEVIERELEKVMPFIKTQREKLLQERNFCASPADEIRKFKQLCDEGIITEEEFQQKKKKLLDL